MIKDKVCEVVGNTSFEALGNGLTESKYIGHVASSVYPPRSATGKIIKSSECRDSKGINKKQKISPAAG